jgi:hypothetical protein
VIRKIYITLALLMFVAATNGVAFYHCCCGISIVEESHACCDSHKKCNTHAHYFKLDNVFQAVHKYEQALHIHHTPLNIVSTAIILPTRFKDSSVGHSLSPPLYRQVNLHTIQVLRL